MVVPSERHVTVTHPEGNTAPVANFTVSCNQNVCTYDDRTSTDERTTLIYTWNFGNGSGSGALPTRTYTTANTYTVTLTVRDEWGLSSTPVTQTVIITEPTNNVAPVPVINLRRHQPAVQLLRRRVGRPELGDTFAYRWDFGYINPTTGLPATSTSSAPGHTFPAAGTYTVTLTTRTAGARR